MLVDQCDLTALALRNGLRHLCDLGLLVGAHDRRCPLLAGRRDLGHYRNPEHQQPTTTRIASGTGIETPSGSARSRRRLHPHGQAHRLEELLVTRSVTYSLSHFLGFSYGFRPGRSPHHALDALSVGIERKKVN